MSRAILQSVGRFSALRVARSRGLHLRAHNSQRRLVLGIESSCDDTGAAVVDDTGRVLGEALHSQQLLHLSLGGIIPPIARDLHFVNIEPVVTRALKEANVSLQELDAIATTVKPGLAMSLLVGMNYGKKLARESGKAFIPIHHMEAHALTIRMIEKIDFPFLVLLISGGHCLISVARSVDDFLLLGHSVDDSPGEAFDKTARRLKLRNLPECSTLSGGEAIELLAQRGNPHTFKFTTPMYKYRDCNFSFAGLKMSALGAILREEKQQGVLGGNVLPNVADICAAFQQACTLQLVSKLHRATAYCERKNLLPSDKLHLVVSGGVACNLFIRSALKQLCDELGFELHCPPVKLCTDNGIMIAWNGMERLLANIGPTYDLDSVDIESKCALGHDVTEDVLAEDIKLPKLKLDFKKINVKLANDCK